MLVNLWIEGSESEQTPTTNSCQIPFIKEQKSYGVLLRIFYHLKPFTFHILARENS